MERAIATELGFSEKRLQRIEAYMKPYIDQGKLAGVLTMIARHGKIAHCQCLGQARIEDNTPIAEDTLFCIYSMTKPITSVAALTLLERGRFHLDDPVSRYIPQFADRRVLTDPSGDVDETLPAEREVTIHDLMRHTSGLTYGMFEEETPGELLYQQANLLRRDRSLEDMVNKLKELPLIHQPGTFWLYSVSTDVLGYLVEVIAGCSLRQFLMKEVFGPLGMNDTDFYAPKDKLERLATTYVPSETGDLMPMPEEPHRSFRVEPLLHSGGGGLVSTAPDYMRFCQMLLNGGVLDGVRLLSPKTIDVMTRNHLAPDLLPFGGPENAGRGFGLGVDVITDITATGLLGSNGTYGWGGAANTNFWIDPKEDLVGLLMLQFMPSGTYPVIEGFRALTYQAMVS